MKKNFFKLIIPLALFGLLLVPFSALAYDRVFETIDGRGTWKRNAEGATEGTFTGTAKEDEGDYSGIWKEVYLKDDPASPYNKKIEETVIINWEGYVDSNGNINGTWKGGNKIVGELGGNWRGSETSATPLKTYTFVGLSGKGEFRRDPQTKINPNTGKPYGTTPKTGTFSGKTSLPDGQYKGTWGNFATSSIGGLDLSVPAGSWNGNVSGGNITGTMSANVFFNEAEALWEGYMENFSITGIEGSGIWRKTTDDSGNFWGDTTAPDGQYKGEWGEKSFTIVAPTVAGNWEGGVKDKKILGVWETGEETILSDSLFVRDWQGTWTGKDPFNSGRVGNYVVPESTPKTTDNTYNFLERLPGFEETFDSRPSEENPCPFGKYLQIIINLIIGICAVLAFVMIVMGGIQYMTSELISSKEAGKSSITNALLGLTIALSAWLVLNTLNPNLLNLCLDKIQVANLTVEAEDIIKRREGGGICTPVKDENNACHPSKLASYFPGSTGTGGEFELFATQASAICNLESNAIANMPIGRSPDSLLDKCSDDKAFSFGLFQINAIAHRESIPACKNAFKIPSGHKQQQGNCIAKDQKSGYCAKWSCTTVEPAYTQCQDYLINPHNNIEFAFKLYNIKKSWGDWTTYKSCKTKF